MKKVSVIFILILLVLISGCSFQEERKVDSSGENTDYPVEDNSILAENQISITVDNITYTATLENNETVKEFKTHLPLTLEMTELNGNEKYSNLGFNLPVDSINPGTINSGDIMLYNSDCLVLFYKDFETNYSYTRIGKIDDPTGLDQALGSGNVTVSFN